MENPLCPRCRTPLPVDALAGLCPACMFEQGAFDSQSNISASAFVPPSIEELAPLFPALEIQELIGRGGMGAVYKARQIELDRVVALKILPSDIARDPAFSERFSREARALAKLSHPGIVALFEFGRSGDLFFFLMEFVDGVTLRQLLLGERLSAREALAIVPRICDALQYAHDRGIVHRDIKPENILLDRQGNVKIADFGLVKLVDPGCASEDTADIAPGSRLKAEIPAHTEVGKVMGTPAYMAPEQIDHPSGVDHRADIYALGVIFYQMLTGELPDKPLSPPSSHVLIDVRLDEVVIRALQRNPSLRFQQAEDLKTRVEEIVSKPDRSKAVRSNFPPLRIAGVLLVLCLPLSIAIPILTRELPPEENLEENTFIAPGPESREAKAEVITQALRPFPGIMLSSQKKGVTTYSSSGAKLVNQWRIGVKDVSQDRASRRLDQAVAAVHEALDRDNADPLRETIHFVERTSMSSRVMIWRGDGRYVRQIRWAATVGIVLSAIGILCVSLPRTSASPPVSKTPGRISLAFLVAGVSGIFVVLKYHSYVGIDMRPVVALVTGVPAMIFGLSTRSGSLGKMVAAISWAGILGLFLVAFIPSYLLLGDHLWEDVAIPPSDGSPIPVVSSKAGRDEGEEKIKAVLSWLETIDAGEYAEGWKRTASLTRLLETEPAWIDKMKLLREPQGKVVGRREAGTQWTSALPGAPEGIYYIIWFATDFTARQKAVETVTLIYQEDGNWRVLGYTIK